MAGRSAAVARAPGRSEAPQGWSCSVPTSSPSVSAPSSRPSMSVSLAPVNHVGDILRPGFLGQQQGNHCP